MSEQKLTSTQYNDRPCATLSCTLILRSEGYPAHMAPGTVVHRARGLCTRCYRLLMNPQAPSPITRTINPDLEAFLAARRRRGIPAEGLSLAVAA